MSKSAAVVLVLCVVFSAVAASAAPGGGSPFKLSVVREETQAVPKTALVRIGLSLDVPEKHKVYRSSVKVSLAADAPGKVVEFKVPPGVRADDPNVPAGETVLVGRSTLVATLSVDVDVPGVYALRPVVEFQGCSDTLCFPPERRTVLVEIERSADDSRLGVIGARVLSAEETRPEDEDLEGLVKRIETEHDFSAAVERSGYLLALLAAFVSGLLVSLTPCVWPLIPITLAVVGAGAEGTGWKRGLGLSAAYVFGMSLTYAVLGALVGLIGQSAQRLAQSPWLIAFVSLVLVALALSMFGLYEIRLPAGLAGKLRRSRGTGFAAVLVMGVLSGVVASPCVSAPLLGLFAGVATLGSVWVGMLAGFIFAWGMGVILLVAGTSSKTLQGLPRAGEWMVAVQHLFGWVLLGAAVWFSHVVIGTAAYRILMGALLAAAVVFLAVVKPVRPGITWKARAVRVLAIVVLLVGLVYLAAGTAAGGIRWVSSVEEGLARAKAEGKPALIDFTADWCAYCGEMDREVLSRASVVGESGRFVMIRRDVTTDGARVAELYRTYGIVGPPAFVFVTSTGEHHTVNRKVDLDTFLRLMHATR